MRRNTAQPLLGKARVRRQQSAATSRLTQLVILC
jgi:hypothetical protein